jgi:acyl carrier protein
VAHGYWRHPVASEETYAGRLATGEGPYLRTGDLGFLRNGQIYIVGRIKDILIIRGRNFSPSDIELTIRGSHPELRRSDGVVFSVEMDGEERLVVAWEVRVRPATFDPKPAIEAIRTAIANEHGVDVHAVALLRPGGVPRTASGKVQRGACRVRFMAQRLDLLASWRAPVEHGADPRQPAGTVRTRRDRAALEVEIETWLVNELASNLGVDSREVDVNRALADFGLDSVQGTRIAADLSILLGRQLPATLVWDHPTIAQLAKHLAEPREVSP